MASISAVKAKTALEALRTTRAAEIHLSPATTRTYVSRILAKLGARDRARLVVLAYETGCVGRARP